MKIGVICPSEVAFRRFMPALQLVHGIEFAGIGVCTKEERFMGQEVDLSIADSVLNNEYSKAKIFIDKYGGKIFNGYMDIVASNEIDALYIPLPPALHYNWAKIALESGKHVLVEKPSTLCARDSAKLIETASKKGLVVHENYMFAFHEQLNAIDKIIASGRIGDVRLYRISFGFPMRDAGDFRYSKILGGGALIDAGGYVLKYATHLLGETAQIKYAQMGYIDGYEVDMYGSGALVNDEGKTVQISFGMDNNYKCDLEVWGSTGCLTTGRVLTAPAGYVPSVTIRNGNSDKVVELPKDDTFKKSIEYFVKCISNDKERLYNYKTIIKQAEIVDNFRHMSEIK